MKFVATTGKPAIQDVSPASSPSFTRAEGDDGRPVLPEDTLRVPADGISDLFQTYVQPIYRYCYGRLGSREAAEDATSQNQPNGWSRPGSGHLRVPLVDPVSPNIAGLLKDR